MKQSNVVLTVLVAGLMSVSLRADDQVFQRGEKNPLRGEITDTSKTELSIKTGTGVKKVPANEVTRVNWDAEPPQLNLHRTSEENGKLDAALAGYQDIFNDTSVSNPRLKADLSFLIARVAAKKALADASLRDQAVQALEQFRQKNANSFRYYDALEYLGRVHLAQGTFDKARAVFTELQQAPWPDSKMAGQIGAAQVLLSEGQIDQALAEFDAVAAAPAGTPAQQQRRHQALLGKANCLRQKNQFDEAVQTLEEVIQQTPPENSGVMAEAFLRKGDCLQAQGDNKAALLAYLHVDVLFPKETAQHAEALFRLATLWNTVGHPDRAQDAAARLTADYAGSEWAAKLSSGG